MNYTTIEQSKKLLELGLSPDTADMYWKESPILNPKEKWIPRIINNLPILFDDDDIIPCWSIGALLKLMPDRTSIFCRYNYTTIDMVDVNNGIVRDKHREEGPTPLEAFYSMIVWLLENGYIKTEKK